MENLPDYININRKTWNNKTEVHVSSDFYDNENFLKGKSSLNSIELDLLGDVLGKRILHLQCHFGQDSLSLARMGALVTGVDLSDRAIDKALEFNQKLGLNASFICSDIYDLPQHLNDQFDIVYTSYGTIGWLPDLDKWAKVISHFLKPKGKFIFVEFHPVIWMYDDHFKEIQYNYFNTEPIIEVGQGTYADKEAPIETNSVCWNHPTSEVINSIVHSGLEINSFLEYDYSPYNCFNETEEIEKGKFRIKHFKSKVPMIFSLVATKKEKFI